MNARHTHERQQYLSTCAPITQSWFDTGMSQKASKVIGFGVLCLLVQVTPALAQTEARLRFGPEREQLCHDYFNLLSRFKQEKALPLCSTQLHELPGAKALDWEAMDVRKNLELLHQIEWQLRFQIRSQVPIEFSNWLKKFQERDRARKPLPRLKRALVTVEPSFEQKIVYSYEESGARCDPKSRASSKNGFGAFILFHDGEQPLENWSWQRGYPFLYGDQLHIFHPYINDKTHYLEWSAYISTFDGNQFRRGESSGYKTKMICGFEDTAIFYPSVSK